MKVFVTGTDTGVGKTVAAAVLSLRLGWRYWKPVQSGSEAGPSDSDRVRALLGPERVLPEAYSLARALAPSQAARAEGREIRLERIFAETPASGTVIEGAGGVLAPLSERALTADLIRGLGCPVVLVARSSLGTINHSLLSLEALRARGVRRIGLLFRGEPRAADRAEIEAFGRVPTLGWLPAFPSLSRDALAKAGDELNLEKLWNASTNS